MEQTRQSTSKIVKTPEMKKDTKSLPKGLAAYTRKFHIHWEQIFKFPLKLQRSKLVSHPVLSHSICTSLHTQSTCQFGEAAHWKSTLWLVLLIYLHRKIRGF